MAAMDKIKALRTQIDDARKQLKDSGKAAFEEATKELFSEHPSLVAFRWEQYTPYFNDGDTCTFSVHEARFQFADTPKDGGDYGDGFEGYGLAPDKESIAKKGQGILDTVGEEALQEIFGDHMQITCHRDHGVTTEGHEHD